MSRKIVFLSTVLSTTVLLSGCSLFGSQKPAASNPTDPPQLSQSSTESGKVVNLTGDSLTEQGAVETSKSVGHPVYLSDANGYVVPVNLEIPKGESPAKQVIQYMIKGGPVEALKPQGFTALLPEGTKILGMTIKEGLATVDFSPEFKKYEAKDEQKIVDALTYALTSFSTVKQVKIWVNGHPLETMPVNGAPVTSLSRENGINMELANNIKPGNSTAVTLYFQSQGANNSTYYVPVTRLIPKSDDKALATLEELIKGPQHGENLFSSILPTTKVLSVKLTNGVAVVDFDDKILSYNDGKASPQALESILLSLTDTAAASKVQFLVNGKATLQAGDKDFSKPVAKPVQVNPGKL